jgi:hypothetical protein
LSRAALAWACGQALRLAIATCVIALVVATMSSEDAAERFATVGYIAAIFAAVALASQRLLGWDRPIDVPSHLPPFFPRFLAFSIGVALAVFLLYACVSQPGSELLILIIALVLVVVAGLARSGTIAAMHAAIMRGGLLLGATRYAVAGAICALVIAAFAPADIADDAAGFAYRLILVAGVFLAASLVAASRLSAWIEAAYVRALSALDRRALMLTFQRSATYAALAAAAAIVLASLAEPLAELFAILAYAAAVACALGLAMECRRLRG